jgi:Tol biopolymer transport system component
MYVQEIEPGSEARDILVGSKLASSPGFGGQMGSGSEDFAAAWTPEGQGIVFAATANRNEAAFADSVQSLFFVPAGGGEPKRLTADSDNYADPVFSRNGKTLFARMEPSTTTLSI